MAESLVGYLNLPDRMRECWPWVCAAAAYDWGDPEPLANLAKQEPPPEEFRPFLSEVILGKRKPNKKSAAKARINPAERLRVAAHVSIIHNMVDLFMGDLDPIAERSRCETADVIDALNNEKRKAKKSAAESLGVGIETVEDLLRDLKARIARWPQV